MSILFLAFLTIYWLPRISLHYTNNSIYFFPPSINKFISDVLYIARDKGIPVTKRSIEFNYKKKYNDYEEASVDLEKFLKKIYGNHVNIERYDNNDEKYSKFVSFPLVSINNENVATISLPGFTGKKSEEKKYISTVQDFLDINKSRIEGIIIDLTSNTGGNMDVFIATVSQLLPEGKLFDFVDNKNNRSSVDLTAEGIKNGKHIYPLKQKNKLSVPIAILGNKNTASSAEILLITLLTNTKKCVFIGDPTGGFVSGREAFKLYDNYYLGLPTRTIRTKDGTNHKSDDPILPNIKAEDGYISAKKWLSKNKDVVDKWHLLGN